MGSVITVDFETFYDKEFSLSKLTTEEYVRSPVFEVIGVAVQVDAGTPEWFSGSHEEISAFLGQYEWETSLVLAHNTMFDGAILSWIFDIHPKGYLDTLSMARAVHGTEAGGSLKVLAKRYALGEKGTAVVDALGKRRADFTETELAEYGDYCVNDTALCFSLFQTMSAGFPRKELRVIDITLRMFIEPVFNLDRALLNEHMASIVAHKEALLAKTGASREELMSNPKFAAALRGLGVEPPLKLNTKGKKAYAFAKTDEAFLALQNHPDLEVQALIAARLGTKSTLEETRTQRFIDISRRGKLPVPVKYCAAHTTRWGGDDKINLQNLPSRGNKKVKTLKRAIVPDPGYSVINGDSSQIEARILAWFAGERGLVSAFAAGEDIYVEMASEIYGVSKEDVTSMQRSVGKAVILGCGFGMGAPRFQAQLASSGVVLSSDECRRIIMAYRRRFPRVPALWEEAQDMLRVMVTGGYFQFKTLSNVLDVDIKESCVWLPSGLAIRYDDLKYEDNEFTYRRRYGRSKIYGGMVVENLVQALARSVIAEQMVLVDKRYRVALTVHDSLAVCVPNEELREAAVYVESCLRTVPKWARGLPLNCSVEVGDTYGDCSEEAFELLLSA